VHEKAVGAMPREEANALPLCGAGSRLPERPRVDQPFARKEQRTHGVPREVRFQRTKLISIEPARVEALRHLPRPASLELG
jgi:hypothetical protein